MGWQGTLAVRGEHQLRACGVRQAPRLHCLHLRDVGQLHIPLPVLAPGTVSRVQWLWQAIPRAV